MKCTINRYVRERLDGSVVLDDISPRYIQSQIKDLVSIGLAERIVALDEEGRPMFQWTVASESSEP